MLQQITNNNSQITNNNQTFKKQKSNKHYKQSTFLNKYIFYSIVI